MLNVKVYSGNLLIGTADLFATDPPMGVAGGKLSVTSDYGKVRLAIDSLNSNPQPDWSALDLKALTNDGKEVHSVGGILISDLVDVYIDEAPDIDILGIADAYELWFGTDPAYRAYYGT
ncbi:hypothetical protein IHQ71_26910 [Rhizobium sp. TH2]|uniref:hypothetical protein n=1 Tax=Rhizobium sp. TH2 TaxID=2775403 RepID=UPI00215871D6|nr:hypothetical protein [Rhizobium sp. TH2]UVC08715.1 hypothetical protein IHQ71_26910 [Rhizobium sp. TH2]